MNSTVNSNSVFLPPWLVEEPWIADYQNNPAKINYIDRLEMCRVTADLSFEEKGEWACTSGDLIACGLIMNMNMRPYIKDRAGCIRIPEQPAQLYLIRSGNQIAYFSRVWNTPGPDTKRHAVQVYDHKTM